MAEIQNTLQTLDKKRLTDAVRIQKGIDCTWSDFCSLDYWINDMTRGEQTLPNKQVLKMAMKHLRDGLYEVHSLLCDLKDKEEERGADDKD